ncbi:hypothetical protein A4A49_02124 [Nicotiana attenuata]|uniref:Uncharacterized protein n=1 Tax=Nicotiana attenuata TaxID=49451 RepID=A0A1J6IQV1_NICAT|nr:hypothetical protein A4A49_02124 [Nicotiana attenuata]
MRLEGKIGTFYNRENGELKYVFVPVNAAEYRDGIRRSLDTVLTRAMRLKGYTDENEIEQRLAVITPHLIHGICVMTYLKLRAVNLFIPTQGERFYNKPKTPAPFEVPVPYALAIQQLGVVEARKRTAFIPTLTKADGESTFLPASAKWNPCGYTQAVEFCKSIGLRFQSVDLSVKIGSSWWLFRPVLEGNYFELRCPLPEDNFTESGSVLHTLFLHDADDGPNNAIMDLSAIPDKNYGSMLRNPPQGISVNSFFAINDDVAQV